MGVVPLGCGCFRYFRARRDAFKNSYGYVIYYWSNSHPYCGK